MILIVPKKKKKKKKKRSELETWSEFQKKKKWVEYGWVGQVDKWIGHSYM